MANFVERAVVDPKIWLARSDLHLEGFEAPFIESCTKAVGRLFFNFKKSHPVRYEPILKRVDRMARATLLAMDLMLLFGYSQPIRENSPPIEWVWEDIKLSFTPDSNWYLVNCDEKGDSRGTGFSNPEEFTYAKFLCKANFQSASNPSEIQTLIP